MEKLAAVVAATALVAGALAVQQSGHHEQPETLNGAALATACDDSHVQILDRSGTPFSGHLDQPYATIVVKPAHDTTLNRVAAQYMPNNPQGLQSVETTNPRMAASPGQAAPAGENVEISISSIASKILPPKTKLGKFASEHGYEPSTLECLTGIKEDATFDKPVSVKVPEQSAPDASLTAYVVKDGDTYASIAANLNAPEKTLMNGIPASQLHPGDILYVKNGEVINADQALRDFVSAHQSAAVEVEKKYGVPHQLTLAQAVVESGYGTSELATKAHNLFGIKASADWKGPVYEKKTAEVYTKAQLKAAGSNVLSSKKRPDGTYDAVVTASFRKYGSVDESFADYGSYLKNRGGGKFYADAFGTSDPTIFLKHLLDDVGAKYATDPQYYPKVETVIQKIKTITQPSAPSQAGIQDYTKEAAQVEAQYPMVERAMTLRPLRDTHEDGTSIELHDLSYEQLLALSLSHIDQGGTEATADGYRAFKITDIHRQIMADPAMQRSFNDVLMPDKVTHRAIVPTDYLKQVKYFVLHFTADPESVDNRDGFGQARSMQKSGLGVNFYTNKAGETYELSDAFVDQVYTGINQEVFGVETAAGAQAAISPKEVTDLEYLAAHFLITNGYLSGGKSAQSVVDQIIRGHGELAEHHGYGGHTDWPKAMVDPFRTHLVKLLNELGYK